MRPTSGGVGTQQVYNACYENMLTNQPEQRYMHLIIIPCFAPKDAAFLVVAVALYVAVESCPMQQPG